MRCTFMRVDTVFTPDLNQHLDFFQLTSILRSKSLLGLRYVQYWDAQFEETTPFNEIVGVHENMAEMAMSSE